MSVLFVVARAYRQVVCQREWLTVIGCRLLVVGYCKVLVIRGVSFLVRVGYVAGCRFPVVGYWVILCGNPQGCAEMESKYFSCR